MSIKSTCFEKSRIVNAERHSSFIQQNTCPFCKKIAGEIGQCQLGCGQLFGFGCFSATDIDSCPKCEKTFDKPKNEYKNRYLNKMVSTQLQIKCTNYNNGCPKILPLSCSDIDKHETECTYYTVSCNKAAQGCQWVGGQAILEQHQQECEFSEYICNYCQQQQENNYTFLKYQKQSHIKNCFNQATNEIISKLKSTADQSQITRQAIEIIEKQQEKLLEANQKIQLIQNYAVLLEKTEEKKRDKKALLQDIQNGILNFNSLENLQNSLDTLNSSLIKGVKLNDTNLSCYEYSYAQKQEFEHTIQKIKHFANSGEKNSQYSLARLYYWGDKNIPQDLQKAKQLVEKSMEQKCPEAFWLMGDLYYENRGEIRQDQQKAYKYYTIAAQMGNGEASNSLGQMYDDGEHVAADEKKALECFEKSARLGDYGGLYNLAVYYQEGYGGLKKDSEKAFSYYLQSAKKGDVDAMKRVSILYKQGKGVQKSTSKSSKWAKKAGFFKNKYNNEIPSLSTLATFNSMNSIQYPSDTNIRSDII